METQKNKKTRFCNFFYLSRFTVRAHSISDSLQIMRFVHRFLTESNHVADNRGFSTVSFCWSVESRTRYLFNFVRYRVLGFGRGIMVGLDNLGEKGVLVWSWTPNWTLTYFDLGSGEDLWTRSIVFCLNGINLVDLCFSGVGVCTEVERRILNFEQHGEFCFLGFLVLVMFLCLLF